MSKQTRCCGTCQHSEKVALSNVRGVCRWGPPTGAALPQKAPMGQMGIQQMSFYPPVTLSDKGCHQYIPKLEVIEETFSEDKEPDHGTPKS